MKDPLISIIIPCKNEGENIRQTINSIRENSDRTPHEIIVVDNASNDGCCDFLRNGKEEGIILVTIPDVHVNLAKNTGAKNAAGDIYVFCDPHVLVEKDWLQKLADTLSLPGIDAVSPGIKSPDKEQASVGGLTFDSNLNVKWLPRPGDISPVPVLPRSCLAVTKKTFEAVKGFDPGFRFYGYDDVEFTVKLWLFGFGAHLNPKVTISHIFRGFRPCALNIADLHFNLLRTAVLHFNQSRLSGIFAKIKNAPYFNEIFTDVILSDAPEQRRTYGEQRVNNDDWFMQKFNIAL